MKTKSSKVRYIIAAGLALVASATPNLRADEVTDWNENMLQAALVAKTSPLVMTRFAAIVQTAVFDAVNGIERRYEPFYVTAPAPRGASRRAAAVQAAYASLVKIYPAQKATLDAQLIESLAAIVDEEGSIDDSQSILRGIAWGQTVADAIAAWRSNDGFSPAPPPFLGGTATGQWRPTPPAFLSGAGPQFAYMTPWVMSSPAQFRPGGPPPLNSAEYAADFSEVKTMGGVTSAVRTDDQTLACQFWNVSTASYYWNRVAVKLATERHATLLDNARLLALLDIAMADAAIACWEAKYQYVFWRPVTAIPSLDEDNNAATDPDPTWIPLLITPNHPEYPSGHSTVSGAAAVVLAGYFGEDTPFTVDSDVLLGVTRVFPNFSAALEEVKNARIFAGIHFRRACDDGQATGQNVATYVLANALHPLRGN